MKLVPYIMNSKLTAYTQCLHGITCNSDADTLKHLCHFCDSLTELVRQHLHQVGKTLQKLVLSTTHI